MTNGYAQDKVRVSYFGRVLAEKRALAQLSLPELASLARLPLDLLQGLEYYGREVPDFEICFRIARAINARRTQPLIVKELWEAALLDRAEREHQLVNRGDLWPESLFEAEREQQNPSLSPELS
jgi:hypothetical protein